MPLGEEIRVLPTLPTRLFIADGELALLPMHSHGDEKLSGALLVHPSGLLDLVIAIFEEYWRDGDPARRGRRARGRRRRASTATC